MRDRSWWSRLQGARTGQQRVQDQVRGRGVVLIALAVILVTAMLSTTSPWRLVDSRVYDYLSTAMTPNRPVDGPVIVAIDEPSFAEIGLQWPWPRDLHARLVNELRRAGAAKIGMDIVFAEPSNPAADDALAAAMGPDVVLAADLSLIETPQASQLVRTEPFTELTQAGAKAGVASIMLDRDAAARYVPGYRDGFARLLTGTEASATPDGALLQSFGPARTYPTVSYYQALDPANFLPPGIFKGRTVIVGLSVQASPQSNAGGADAFATSWTTRTGALVSGAEIQATIHDNLKSNLFITPIGWAGVAGAIACAAGLAAFAVWGRTGWVTVIVALLAVAAMYAGSLLLLRYGRVYVPPIAPSFAFLAVAAAQGGRDYAAERRMRHDITRAFSQYLSPVLVERLASNPAQLKLGGERRTLSILFCDVRGFTTISESMKDDPERLTRLVNRLLNPLSEVVIANGGTIDKYIGDCIMAFWNAPLDDTDHAVHAVQAGIGMLAALDRLNADLAAEAAETGEVPLHLAIGIGINTGDCVVGNLGSDRRFDYSALGDAVNLASRLESLTKTYGVSMLLGSETARLAGEKLKLIELDSIAVKGKSEVSRIWTIAEAAPNTTAGLDQH